MKKISPFQFSNNCFGPLITRNYAMKNFIFLILNLVFKLKMNQKNNKKSENKVDTLANGHTPTVNNCKINILKPDLLWKYTFFWQNIFGNTA